MELIAYIEARQKSKGPKVPLSDDSVKKLRNKGLTRYNLEEHSPYVTGYWMHRGHYYGMGGTTLDAATSAEGVNDAGLIGETSAGGCDAIVNDACGAAACGSGTW